MIAHQLCIDVNNIEDVIRLLRESSKIIVLTGAGVSVCVEVKC